MPEPINRYFATDKIIYEYIVNPIASKLCFLSPNVITLLCFLLIFPIINNIQNNQYNNKLIYLFIIRGILDCLDGALARTCNKKSDFGAKFDIMNDSISFVILTYILLTKAKYNNYIFLIFFITTSIYMIRTMFSSFTDNFSYEYDNPIIIFVHDNNILLWVIVAIIINKYFKT